MCFATLRHFFIIQDNCSDNGRIKSNVSQRASLAKSVAKRSESFPTFPLVVSTIIRVSSVPRQNKSRESKKGRLTHIFNIKSHVFSKCLVQVMCFTTLRHFFIIQDNYNDNGRLKSNVSQRASLAKSVAKRSESFPTFPLGFQPSLDFPPFLDKTSPGNPKK